VIGIPPSWCQFLEDPSLPTVLIVCHSTQAIPMHFFPLFVQSVHGSPYAAPIHILRSVPYLEKMYNIDGRVLLYFWVPPILTWFFFHIRAAIRLMNAYFERLPTVACEHSLIFRLDAFMSLLRTQQSPDLFKNNHDSWKAARRILPYDLHSLCTHPPLASDVKLMQEDYVSALRCWSC